MNSANYHTWFPNTGATHHATTLSSPDEYNGSDTLRVGDSTQLSISHVGRVSLSTPYRSLSLSNILHVSNLSTSLLSVQHFASDNNVFF